MEEKKIYSITVVDIGTIFAIEEPIEVFHKNGEMALVEWYKQGNREWNGKYVIEVEYYRPPTN